MYVVGIDQRVGIWRIAVELAVIKLDRADVLLAAIHGLKFAVALNLFGSTRHGYRKPQREYSQHKHHPDEKVSFFRAVGSAGWNIGLHMST